MNVFPYGTHHGIVSVEHRCHARYTLSSPWSEQGYACFRRSLTRWFRLLRPGTYMLTVSVHHSHGAHTSLHEQIVHSPLERDGILESSGLHEPIMTALARLSLNTGTDIDLHVCTCTERSDTCSSDPSDDLSSCSLEPDQPAHSEVRYTTPPRHTTRFTAHCKPP